MELPNASTCSLDEDPVHFILAIFRTAVVHIYNTVVGVVAGDGRGNILILSPDRGDLHSCTFDGIIGMGRLIPINEEIRHFTAKFSDVVDERGIKDALAGEYLGFAG